MLSKSCQMLSVQRAIFFCSLFQISEISLIRSVFEWIPCLTDISSNISIILKNYFLWYPNNVTSLAEEFEIKCSANSVLSGVRATAITTKEGKAWSGKFAKQMCMSYFQTPTVFFRKIAESIIVILISIVSSWNKGKHKAKSPRKHSWSLLIGQ